MDSPTNQIRCNSSFSYEIEVAYACLNAFSGLLSVMGSSVVVYMIMNRRQKKLSRVKYRLMLAMSTIDVLNSCALAISFLPAPSVAECSFGKGNFSTCTAQGFFLQLGLAVPAYTAMLTLRALGSIVYNFTEKEIARKFEPFMHIIAICPMLGIAVAGTVSDMCHSNQRHCYITNKRVFSRVGIMGGDFVNGRWILITSVVWFSVMGFIIAFSMVKIYLTTRQRAKMMRRYAFVSKGRQQRRSSKIDKAADESAKQTMMHVFAYILTFSCQFTSIVFTSHMIRSSPLLFLATGVLYPLQGFWNFLLYIRPKFLAVRSQHENLSVIRTLKIIIHS